MFNYTGRLYTFGCSMTSYFYPTWADILGQEFSYYENWGEPGAGNTFIFNSVVECLARNNITNNDTIIVMWSGISRIDYYKHRWIHSTHNVLSKTNDALNCADGFEIMDYALIHSLEELLTAKGIPHHFWSWCNYNKESPAGKIYRFTLDKIVEFTLPRLNIKIEPKTLETVENNRKLYNRIAGSNWPTFENVNADLSKYTDKIQKEVAEFNQLVQDSCERLTNASTVEIHPSPVQYLDTITSKLPIVVSDKTKNWVHDIDNKIRTKQPYNFIKSIPRERL